jgi:hypothetical protein
VELCDGESVVIGLLRPRGTRGSALPYVVTNPTKSTKLLVGEAVYVLARY